MGLTTDDKEFLQKWEIDRQRKRIIIRLIAWPVFMTIFTTLFDAFDSNFNFNAEAITTKSLLISISLFFITWGIVNGLMFYFNEKRYKKLIDKKSQE